VERQVLTFRTARAADNALLSVVGELDMATAESLFKEATALMGDGTRMVVLDLDGVTFCDSLGLAALARIYRHGNGVGCRLRLTNLRGHVAHVIQISGLDQAFEV
jgi:anti-sigma B factor antagonist